MPAELAPSRRLRRIGSTTPENSGVPMITLHEDPTALANDHIGVDLASLDTGQLGRVLKPRVGTRHSLLQVNTGGDLASNHKLKNVNHFPSIREVRDGKENHYAPTDWREYAERLQHYDRYLKELFDRHPETYMTVSTPSGLAVAMETDGKIGVIKSIEGMPKTLGRASLREAMHDLVALDTQIVDLMWNEDTAWGHWHRTDVEDRDSGLTELGRNFLTACAESGIRFFDVSHASWPTALDMIEHSNHIAAESLVVATHTGARIGKAFNNSRNIPDLVANEIIDQGGLIGVGVRADMVGGNTIKDVVRVIEHFASLRDGKGINHVALGPDFNGTDVGKEMPGLSNIVELQNLAGALREAGFSEEEISKIFWENVYNVLYSHLPKEEAA